MHAYLVLEQAVRSQYAVCRDKYSFLSRQSDLHFVRSFKLDRIANMMNEDHSLSNVSP